MCWAQPPCHSHPVTGAHFHGLQRKAEGQEALTMRYTYIQLCSTATCVRVGGWLCVMCSRQGAHLHMQSNG